MLILRFLAATALAVVGLPSTPASAGNTICVALVVDFSTLGGNVDSGCTRVPPGSTGYDVLHAGGHTYEVCSNGIIGTIDGQPANGCQIKDNNHFWGYWHRKPGSRTWTFSNYGAGFYHPVEGSTEGWVWEDGTTNPPADVAYPAGCHSPPAPSPSASNTQQTEQHAAATTRSPAPSHSATSSAATPTASTPATAASHNARKHHQKRRNVAVTSAATPAADAAPARSNEPSTLRAIDPRDPPSGGGRTQSWLLAVAAVAVAGIGLAAWWRARRNRPEP